MKQTELAKIWGVTQQYVSKLVRQGMPLDSVEAAAAWRDEQAQRGLIGNQSAAVKNATVAPLALPAASPDALGRMRYDSKDDRGQLLLQAGEQLRETVTLLREQIASAKTANERAQATRDYLATFNQLQRMEKELPAILRQIGAVLDAMDVQQGTAAAFLFVARTLRALPHRFARDLMTVKTEEEACEIMEESVERAIGILRDMLMQGCHLTDGPDGGAQALLTDDAPKPAGPVSPYPPGDFRYGMTEEEAARFETAPRGV